ncbi:DUF4395 domain-containing protein [Sulfurospirillum sp. 1612]|uniref:DUF4395 domain-containing protein n=1 Tax=Sulfurospirillum sp. 1612 TaxID=3094835 RepID=UPI002F92B25F
MSQSCPISNRKINGNLVRVYSIQVVLLGMLLLITTMPIFALILLYDFSIRALRLPNLSPIHLIGKFIIETLHIKPEMTDEAPKRFALFIGLFFSLSLSILYAGGSFVLGAVIAGILVVCALLEALFNYCVGCKVYQLLQLLKK